jgi:hypothetical protein
MVLSNDLLAEFAKITNDRERDKGKEAVLYGTIVEDGGVFYVKIDGSDLITPISSTANVKNGERVTVMLKNHTAIVTGNLTSPSASIVDIGDISDAAGKIIVGFEVRLSEVEGSIGSNTERITISESTIRQLVDSIATIVTDSNGNSMMTQTSTGWTFNMSAIEDTLNKAVNGLGEVSENVDNVSDALSKLESLANDITQKTAYIAMTTDENGDPCLELGKSDNPFKVRITNNTIDFMDGTTKIAYASNESFLMERAVVKNEFMIGEGSGFVWKKRGNGNMGLRWVGGN